MMLTVSQANGYIRQIIECDPTLSEISILGEISNFKHHSSGHMYFSLKDEKASISAAMFRFQNKNLKFVPQNGMRVIAHGKISVYEPSGQYQIVVSALEPDGVGVLYEAFEKLKAKLEQEGLFAPERKQTLPMFPRRIGVVTSKTGAAIKDILSVTSRRWPLAQIVLYPAQVQGVGAAQEIAAGIEYHNRHSTCDVMIVGRGGGSIEDLWCFNDECVARAIAASKIPVVSAVGHEIDFTISDFVADVRAATPSAAAELVVPDSSRFLASLDTFVQQNSRLLRERINRMKLRVRSVCETQCMKNPLSIVESRAQRLDAAWGRTNVATASIVSHNREWLAACAAKIEALSPMAVLARGYSLAFKANAPVTSVESIAKGDEISIRLVDGTARCIVQETASDK